MNITDAGYEIRRLAMKLAMNGYNLGVESEKGSIHSETFEALMKTKVELIVELNEAIDKLAFGGKRDE